jgi:hypothetical protein
MLICNSAIGNSNWGNWDPQFQLGQLANWQFNPIEFPQFNEGNSLIGFAAAGFFGFWVRRRRRRSRITAVVPYLCYARKFLKRTPQPAIGWPLLLRAIVIEGAGAVGQPSPDTIHHRRPAAPRQPLRAVEAVVSAIYSGLGAACGRPQARYGDRRKRRGGKDRPVSRGG